MSNAIFHRDINSTTRILYIPSNFAKLSLFHLQEIGTLHATQPHTSGREFLSSYLFFLVNSGSGILRYNSKEYSLRAGDCVFIDCRHPYSHTTDDSLWNISWIHFDGPSMAPIYQKYIERGGQPVFKPTDIVLFTSLLNAIHNTASSSSFTRDMEINTDISRLLTALMTIAWRAETATTTNKRSSMLEIRRYLDHNFAKKITLDDLSERFFINKYYMTRIFKEQFGISIMDYLINVRVTEAKNLLRFTKGNAETIAAKCGFSDVYYFSRLFKKVEGIGIREFKKQWGARTNPKPSTPTPTNKVATP